MSTNTIFHFLVPAVHLIFFTLPPFRFRRFLFITATALLAYPSLFDLSDVGSQNTSTRYAVVDLWLYHLGSVTKMAFHSPEHDFWRDGKPAHEAEALGFGWAKLKWASSLLLALRGVGWNFRVYNVPQTSPAIGKTRFLLKLVLDMAWIYLGLDFVTTFLQRIHFTQPTSKIEDLGTLYLLFVEIVVGLQPYLALKWQFAQWSFLFTVMGFARDTDWPPFFGPWSSITSLRAVWGSFWHQNLRVMLDDFGKFACRMFRLNPKSQIGRLVRVWVAFAVSGGMHGLISWSLQPVPPFTGSYERFTTFFIFFMLQAVGITIEDIIFTHPVKGKGPTKTREISRANLWIQRIWTASWLLFSGRWAAECWLKTEQGNIGMPYSIVSHFL